MGSGKGLIRAGENQSERCLIITSLCVSLLTRGGSRGLWKIGCFPICQQIPKLTNSFGIPKGIPSLVYQHRSGFWQLIPNGGGGGETEAAAPQGLLKLPKFLLFAKEKVVWSKGFPERIHWCFGPQNVTPGEELMVWGEALWDTPIFMCPVPQPRVKPVPGGNV